MQRVRNAVVIIILCIIGAMTFKSRKPQLSLNMPSPEQLKDAVAGTPTQHHRGRHRPLTLASGHTDDLRDAVAGHAVGTPNETNTLGDVGAPPRGSGNGGFAPLSVNNNNNNPPPNLSPSGPKDDEQYQQTE